MPSALLTATRAPILEVFASVQGEGLHVGEPQVFVRLAGCPLRCRYCDTPGSWAVPAEGRARIDAPEGSRREPGEARPFEVAQWVREVEGGPPRTVSVTGGEPLLWPEFVRGLGPLLGERRLHLETAGAYPEALEAVLDRVHHVSLDLKLDADLDPPAEQGSPAEPGPPADDESWREVRARVLDLLADRDACAKLVVTGEGPPDEYGALLEDVWERAPDLPVVLQPATPMRGASAPSRAVLETLQRRALELGLTVRVVPQVHRALGLP